MQPQSVGQLKPEAAKIITQICVRALLRARQVAEPNTMSPNLNPNPNLTPNLKSKQKSNRTNLGR
ncbi:MAG: hypothetical protein A2201_02385 [Alicyclobacillus sp. RIFOXYA1_FULL_53_8]|nr:MAG: hypothetical protein A2201_02385 [Alicyclobacillus sp. RIFOXYA1_FULL_53_8]